MMTIYHHNEEDTFHVRSILGTDQTMPISNINGKHVSCRVYACD